MELWHDDAERFLDWATLWVTEQWLRENGTFLLRRQLETLPQDAAGSARMTSFLGPWE
jgi:hypothetical protein